MIPKILLGITKIAYSRVFLWIYDSLPQSKQNFASDLNRIETLRLHTNLIETRDKGRTTGSRGKKNRPELLGLKKTNGGKNRNRRK